MTDRRASPAVPVRAPVREVVVEVVGHDRAAGRRDRVEPRELLGCEPELERLDAVAPPGRAIVPYYLDDDFADWRPHRHRW